MKVNHLTQGERRNYISIDNADFFASKLARESYAQVPQYINDREPISNLLYMTNSESTKALFPFAVNMLPRLKHGGIQTLCHLLMPK